MSSNSKWDFNLFKSISNLYHSTQSNKKKTFKINDPFQSYKFSLDQSYDNKQKQNILEIYYRFIQRISILNTSQISGDKYDQDPFDIFYNVMSLNNNSNIDNLGEITILIDNVDWGNRVNNNSNNIYLSYFNFKYKYNEYLINEYGSESNLVFFMNKEKLLSEYRLLKLAVNTGAISSRSIEKENDLINHIDILDRKQNDNNTKLKEYINKIINFSKKRFLILSVGKLSLNILTSSSGVEIDDVMPHANLILIDKTKKTVEYYEPWGSFVTIDNLNILKDIFPSDFKFVETRDYGKKIGVQNKFWNIDKGYCLLYCVWYAFLRINNPDTDRDDIIDYMLNSNVEVDCIHIFNKIKNLFIEYDINYYIFPRKGNLIDIKDYNFIDFNKDNADTSEDKTFEVTNILKFIRELQLNLKDDKFFAEVIISYNRDRDYQDLLNFKEKLLSLINNINLSNDSKCNTYFIKDFLHKILNVLYTFTHFIYNYSKLMNVKHIKWVSKNLDNLEKDKIKGFFDYSVTNYKKKILNNMNKWSIIENEFTKFLSNKLEKIGAKNVNWYSKVKDGNLYYQNYLARFLNYLGSFFYTDYFKIDDKNHSAFFLLNDIGFNNIFIHNYIPYYQFFRDYTKNWLGGPEKIFENKYYNICNFDDYRDDKSINGFLFMNNFYILLNKLEDKNKNDLIEYLHEEALYFLIKNNLYDIRIRKSSNLGWKLYDPEYDKLYKASPSKNIKLIPKFDYLKRINENAIEFIKQRKKEIVLST